MRILTSPIVWGLLLIAGGILFLLENLQILEIADVFWAVLFGVGGIAFLSVFAGDRRKWWALIPGIILLDLAALVAVSVFFPNYSEQWGGPVFLAGIGLAFFAVYAASPQNWWAIIPGGVMFTLAAVSGLENLVSLESGGLFFAGLGLTFLLLAILPRQGGGQRWAFFPAAVLLVMGVVLLAGAGDLLRYLNFIWPVVLIMAGLYLLFRAFISRRRV